MENLTVNPIGKIVCADDGMRIVLDKSFAPALDGLDGFSHIQVIWWFSAFDNAQGRNAMTVDAPYTHSPNRLGTFATRSPMRPNPIALDCAEVTYLDHENATIGVAFIDAFDSSPVLDIKPYTPGLDRVENPIVPEWCRHWPKSHEVSGDFDWAGEMNV